MIICTKYTLILYSLHTILKKKHNLSFSAGICFFLHFSQEDSFLKEREGSQPSG